MLCGCGWVPWRAGRGCNLLPAAAAAACCTHCFLLLLRRTGCPAPTHPPPSAPHPHTRPGPNPAAHTAHLPVRGQHHPDAGGQHGAQHAVRQHVGSILEVGDVGDAGANGGRHAAALRGQKQRGCSAQCAGREHGQQGRHAWRHAWLESGSLESEASEQFMSSKGKEGNWQHCTALGRLSPRRLPGHPQRTHHEDCTQQLKHARYQQRLLHGKRPGGHRRGKSICDVLRRDSWHARKAGAADVI
jgi:hypothetical protein